MKLSQQSILHQLRLEAFTYNLFLELVTGTDDKEEKLKLMQSLLQQSFAYSCAQFSKLQAERKEQSIPGSTSNTDDVLFGRDEVSQVGMKSKVNSLKRPFQGMPQATGLGPYSFRPYTFAGRFQSFKGSKGYCSPKGYGSFRGKGTWRPPRGAFGSRGRGMESSTGKDHHSLLSQGEKSIADMEKDGLSQGSRRIDPEGSVPWLDISNITVQTNSKKQRDGGRSKAGIGRVQESWCSEPGPSPNVALHKVFVSIVSKKKMEISGKEKCRLISDCRDINKHLQTKHFKLDHWQHIFPVLRKGMWGVKVDLKHAYFHLELGETLKPYMRMLVGEEMYQLKAACFGLATLPQQWMSLMKVQQKYLRKRGLIIFIYLDDILLVSQRKILLKNQTIFFC